MAKPRPAVYAQRGRRLLHGYHVVLVEACCFDRSLLSHKVNLFDMHHKYADVMHTDEVVAHLARAFGVVAP